METPEQRRARSRAAAAKRWAGTTPEERREATVPGRLACYEVKASRRMERLVDEVVRKAGTLTPEQLDMLRSLLPAPAGEHEKAAS